MIVQACSVLLLVSSLGSTVESRIPDIRNCAGIQCPALRFCRPDQRPYFDGCCTVCRPLPNCELTRCPELDCAAGSYTPPNSCCPVCRPTIPLPTRPDCTDVECPDLDCEGGRIYRNPTSCCPTCRPTLPTRPDCSNIQCPALDCDGGRTVTPPFSCCPTCLPTFPTRPDCSNVQCPALDCDGGRTVTPPFSCCPTCLPTRPTRPDCSNVQCPALDCDGGRTVTSPFSCCPRCLPSFPPRPDCSAVECPPVTCERSIQIPGRCCRTCLSSPVTLRPGCMWKGSYYEPGDEVPSHYAHCTRCTCSRSGRVNCRRQTCAPIRNCRGRVRVRPGQCCPVCITH